MYDQIFKPSKLPGNADFHLFKAGVEPKWEDPECANGGKWTVTSNRKANLDTMWLETVISFSFYHWLVFVFVFKEYMGYKVLNYSRGCGYVMSHYLILRINGFDVATIVAVNFNLKQQLGG